MYGRYSWAAVLSKSGTDQYSRPHPAGDGSPGPRFHGREFRAIAEECYEGLRHVFRTEQAIIAYAANGHGAWEAAIVNVFSPGDKVLVLESGWFSVNWGTLATELGIVVETLPAIGAPASIPPPSRLASARTRGTG